MPFLPVLRFPSGERLIHLRNLKDQSTRARIDQEIELRRFEKAVAAEKLVVDLDVEEMGGPTSGESRRQRPFSKRSVLGIGDHRFNDLIGWTGEFPHMDAGRNVDEQVSGDRVTVVRTGVEAITAQGRMPWGLPPALHY